MSPGSKGRRLNGEDLGLGLDLCSTGNLPAPWTRLRKKLARFGSDEFILWGYIKRLVAFLALVQTTLDGIPSFASY